MMVTVEGRFRRARIWSNTELRRLAPLFPGHVVNVSGWRDEDKEGRVYKDYFIGAETYSITNYAGDCGFQGMEGEIPLDLEMPLPDDLARRFDVVFNHTALEHIFDVAAAFRNMCEMARDAVIVIVPFAQVEHWTESYGDYWRFTGQALDRLYRQNGFTPIYCSANEKPDEAVYVLAVGVREPEKWAGRLPSARYPRPLAEWLGRPKKWEKLAARLFG